MPSAPGICNLAAVPDLRLRLALQPPTITGRYSSATFSFFMEPAQGEFCAVMDAFKAMTRTAGLALRGSGCGQYRQLQDGITALEGSRSVPVPS